MDVSRREFMVVAASTISAISATGCGGATPAPPAAMLANHVGFRTKGSKFVLCRGAAAQTVTLRRKADGAVRGTFPTGACGGDLGAFTIADLTAVDDAGEYVASIGDGSSIGVRIATMPYASTFADAFNYFRQQRCGHPTVGYHAPCHLDDGRRSDDGAHHDAVGGWHDACDLRKWVDATIYGVLGIGRALDVLGAAHPCRDVALDEVRWGNGYFLKMQAADGSVMRWCAGDDGNHFTDNRAGTADDRIVDVAPSELPGQFLFVAAEALMSRLHAGADAAYAAVCLAAAERCMRWCADRAPEACLSIATGASAAVALHACGVSGERAAAVARYASALVDLQSPDGWFRSNVRSAEPFRDAQHGNACLLALCDLVEALPGHADAPRWRAALARHVEHLESMAGRSAFGIVPYGLYASADPGGGRRVGDLWYRWFMRQRGEYKDADWWVGNSAHLCSNGIGLRRAADLLGTPTAAVLAQRHLDWMLGANPFDATLVSGSGRNVPRVYRPGTFSPPTPTISGGVLNGIGGDGSDRAELSPGAWQTCEYWTPNVALTHWLLALFDR